MRLPVILITAGMVSLFSLPREGIAEDSNATRVHNALQDMARAQRDRSESMRRVEQGQRDQARTDRNARHNAEVTSRSMRRFDR